MELIYCTRRKPLKYEPPHYSSMYEIVRPVVTISSGNIIAFSSVTELSDTEGDTWGGHVYVCDLDTPWDAQKVCSTVHHVSSLAWDLEGKQLLVATIEGEVSVYSQKDYLLNEWTCATSVQFPGEHIVKAVYFDSGRRVVHKEGPLDAPVTDRIQVSHTPPTFKGFGGVGADGWWVVSRAGRAGAVCGGRRVSAALSPHTHTHPAIDVTTHKSGSALVCLGGEGYVRVSSVALSADFDLRVTPWPTLYLPDQTQPHLPMSLTWSGDDGDAILVGGHTLTLWKLAEKAYPIHKLLLSSNPSGAQIPEAECFKTLVWQAAESWSLEGGAARGHSHSLTHSHTHLYHLNKSHLSCVRVVPSQRSPDAAPPPKLTKYETEHTSGRISACCVSVLGNVGVALDTRSQLYVYSLPRHAGDTGSPASVQYSVSLLEYSLVCGYDCIDLIMATKPQHRQILYDRLTEMFPRHSQMFQQYYYHRWMAVRLLLCRCTPGLEYGASVLSSLQTAMAVAHTLRHDDIDDDKLEVKCESACGGVWAGLRDVTRRVRDIATTALVNISNNHCVEMHKEAGALAWCVCAVNAARGEAGDSERRVLQTLTTICSLGPHPPTHDLIEECNSLVSSLPTARVWESSARCSVSAPVQRETPLIVEYGVEPECLRYAPEPPAGWDTISNDTRDCVSLIFVGSRGWRRCGRCGSSTVSPHQPLEERYRTHCRCGGRWTQVTNRLIDDCDS